MNKRTLILLLSGVMLMSSCATAVVAGAGAAVGTGVAVGTDDRGANTVFSDSDLASKAKDIANSINSNGSYTVSAYNGKVLLAGQVPSYKSRGDIVASVQSMNGVKGVWDYMTVGPNQSFGQVTKDTYITSATKTRLIAQKDVNTNNIKVVTCDGVVFLMGDDIGDQKQLISAISGIRTIDGVRNVVDFTQ